MSYPLGDLEVEKLNSQVVRIGTIGDQSCFYHGVCKAVCKEYQENPDYKYRQSFCDNFRRSVGEWLITENKEITPSEARRWLNLSKPRLTTLFDQQVKDPECVEVTPFQTTPGWYFKLYGGLSHPDAGRRATTIRWILDNTLNSTKKYTIHNYHRLARFTEEELTSHLTSLGLTTPIMLPPNLQKYLEYIDTNLYNNKTTQQILEPLKSSVKRVLEPHIKAKVKMSCKLRGLIGSTSVIYSKYTSERSRDYIERIHTIGVEALYGILGNSINVKTNRKWTKSEIDEYLDSDPRSPNKDPAHKSPPININYYLMDGGVNIERSKLPNDHGVCTFQLPNLLSVTMPRYTDKGMVRIDAGEEDIIPLIPHIIGVSIYLVDSNLSLKGKYLSKPRSPIIVLYHLGNHFEVIGWISKGSVSTMFSESHPIIRLIEENSS